MKRMNNRPKEGKHRKEEKKEGRKKSMNGEREEEEKRHRDHPLEERTPTGRGTPLLPSGARHPSPRRAKMSTPSRSRCRSTVAMAKTGPKRELSRVATAGPQGDEVDSRPGKNPCFWVSGATV